MPCLSHLRQGHGPSASRDREPAHQGSLSRASTAARSLTHSSGWAVKDRAVCGDRRASSICTRPPAGTADAAMPQRGRDRLRRWQELLNVAWPEEVFLDQLVDELPSYSGTGSESQEDWQAGEETAQKA